MNIGRVENGNISMAEVRLIVSIPMDAQSNLAAWLDLFGLGDFAN
ncbi:MAG: hypothetical protein OXD44_07615 [Gammaproteobacteria bacterium]|nr:hypothetical protein [Gammaproteobacteria bacterium]